MDLVDHLDSILFVPCISLKDDWFASYKSLAKKEKYIKHFVNTSTYDFNFFKLKTTN